MKYICSECKGDNIQSKCWANPNNDEVIEYVGDDVDDNWCSDCCHHIDLEIEDE